ncbi:MAG: gamma-glutamyl-gamma-aminobutyrate hydrolase family protein [Succinatimonas hippei]|nr:gamma-glutamyl-gamma-aminobutyrate hydrolase family protein [Succinatimonas hippei]
MVTIGLMPLWDEARKSVWMLPGYIQGVIKAGALPIVLPLTSSMAVISECARRCDGFLFTGGQDVSPSLYGQKARDYCGENSVIRDEMDSILINYALEQHKPFLGICRGLQILNAVLGGTLHQDIKIDTGSTIEHMMKKPYERGAHKVSLVKGGYLARLMGAETISVNSIHHQGVDALSPRLEPLAYAEDGLCEAAMVRGENFALAVQWHPEILYVNDSAQMRLFQALTDAASLSVHMPGFSYSA